MLQENSITNKGAEYILDALVKEHDCSLESISFEQNEIDNEDLLKIIEGELAKRRGLPKATSESSGVAAVSSQASTPGQGPFSAAGSESIDQGEDHGTDIKNRLAASIFNSQTQPKPQSQQAQDPGQQHEQQQ